jgi:hypothetical protein
MIKTRNAILSLFFRALHPPLPGAVARRTSSAVPPDSTVTDNGDERPHTRHGFRRAARNGGGIHLAVLRDLSVPHDVVHLGTGSLAFAITLSKPFVRVLHR